MEVSVDPLTQGSKPAGEPRGSTAAPPTAVDGETGTREPHAGGGGKVPVLLGEHGGR